MTSAVCKNLGLSVSRLEYTHATSIVNKGPIIRVGKLYPTDSEALHASNKAINAIGTLSSSRAVLFETWYSTVPSTIPITPKDTVARLPWYSPIAIKAAGTTVNIDAPRYAHARLARSSGAALVLNKNIEQNP